MTPRLSETGLEAVTVRRLDRAFYTRSALQLAPQLLNKVLSSADGAAGRIVEVEAYGGDCDPGSHARRGPTKRNAAMFGPAGHLYVYFTYGMHWCVNVVADSEGVAAAVLLRALEPLRGVDAMRAARGPKARRDRDLCNGPAKLASAMGIDGSLNTADLLGEGARITILDDATPPPTRPDVSPRIGLSNGSKLPWRFCVPGSPYLSRP